MKEAVGEVFPDDKYQRCTVHFGPVKIYAQIYLQAPAE